MKNKKRCKLKVVPYQRGNIVTHMQHLGDLQRFIVNGRVESIAVAVTFTDGGYSHSFSAARHVRKALMLGAIYELLAQVQHSETR